jgi:DNA-binding SARP family transcriptional activator
MTSESDPAHDRLDSDQLDWQAIHRYLNVGDYENVAEILLEAQLVWEQTEATILVQLLATACRVCLACSQSRAEVDWHRRARQEADQRERELRQQLFTILELIGGLEAPETTAEPGRRADIPPLETPFLDRGTQPDSEPPSLWQRIQTFFGMGATPPSSERQPARVPEDAGVSRVENAAARAETPAEVVDLPPPADTAPSSLVESGEVTEPPATRPVPPAGPTGPIDSGELTTPSAEEAGRPLDPHPVLPDALPPPPDSKTATEQPTEGVTRPVDPHPVQPGTPVSPKELALAETPPTEDLAEPAVAQPVNAKAPSGDDEEGSSSRTQEIPDAPLAQSLPPVPPTASLVVYCLGPFRVYQDDQLVKQWPSSKGKAIFKYLIMHRERPVPKEVLMELFWPGSDPDAARNNLNVAIYGLRQALRKARPSFSHVLFQDDCYLLNPELTIWLDVEAFMERLASAKALEKRGELKAAVQEYTTAEALYEGEFLEEDRYEDWVIPRRERLRQGYLDLLDRLSRYYYDQGNITACTAVCRKTLTVDTCREEAHRRLMRCYSRQGQPYLALRQYHSCVEALKEELDVPPTSATTQLSERIRRGELDTSV